MVWEWRAHAFRTTCSKSGSTKPKNPRNWERTKHLKKQYEIRLNVREIAKGEIIYVHNAVIYKNAFDGKQKDWFHSHVNLPTKSLTIILLFPDGQRCKSIAGYEKVGKNAATEVGSDKGMPIIVDDGKLSYWR